MINVNVKCFAEHKTKAPPQIAHIPTHDASLIHADLNSMHGPTYT